MAVDLTITGNGGFAGAQGALSDYSSVEDATPLDPSKNTGGIGQLNFTVVDKPDAGIGTLSLMNDTVTLSDGSNGTTVGTVTGVTIVDGVANVQGDSRLGLLLATRTAQPLRDTPANIFTYYLGLAGITSGIVIDASLKTGSVAVQGWTGTIWDNIRQFALTQNAEVALVSNNVVFRKIRGRIANNLRNITEQVDVQKSNLAQTVEVNYYNNRYAVDAAYPDKGVWTPETQVYQVDAGEILEFNVPISASLDTVYQPTCVAFVPRYGAQNVYSVIGQDGLPIPPSQWTSNGGSLTVTIGADTKSLDIRLVGARSTQAPYRIAVASSASDTYSSLRINGQGTFFDKQTLVINTGAAASETAELVGITVDNPNISTLSQAYDFGIRAAASYGGYQQTISITTVGINRTNDSGSAAYPTFDQFNAGGLTYNGATTPSWAGKTFDDFTTTWSGQTFNQFNAYYFSFVANSFQNQAFGNVAGARVPYRNAMYRISTATITPMQVSYTGEMDTMFSDFQATWTSQLWDQNPNTVTFTFNDFATIQAGRTFNDFNMTPLWRTYNGSYAPK